MQVAVATPPPAAIATKLKMVPDVVLVRDLGHDIHPVATFICPGLYHSASVMIGLKIFWINSLWLGSLCEFPVISPSHVPTSGAPVCTGVSIHCSTSPRLCCFPVSMGLQVSICHQPLPSFRQGSCPLCFYVLTLCHHTFSLASRWMCSKGLSAINGWL